MNRPVRRRPDTQRTPRFLRGEKLESRDLLAAQLGWDAWDSKGEARSIATNFGPATHFYQADGERIGLRVASDRLAVGISPADASRVLGEEVTRLRTLGDAIGVYAGPFVAAEENRQRLQTHTEVSGVYPVFINVETGTEAVLTNEIIVALRPQVDASDYFSQRAEIASFEPLRGTTNQFIAQLSELTGEAALAYSEVLAADQFVEWVAPNFYQNWRKASLPNDPRFNQQWHLHNTGQGGGLAGADSNLLEAWQVQSGGVTSFVIGVIDDGIESHPDLLRWTNPGEIAGNGIDDDGNGWIDDIHGWNFVANNNAAQPTTSLDSHGTAVAGVAAALGNNNTGVIGASAGAAVLSARIFEGDNVASDARIAEAIYYSAGSTASGSGTWSASRILNNSWGGGGTSSAINTAITWAANQGNSGNGALLLFASGNDYFNSVSYPADRSFTTPGVIAVGATNNLGERSDYSNYGFALDFVAPSNDTRAGYLAIDTTDRIGSAGYASGDYTGTGSSGFGGTSSATPLASGIAALAMMHADTSSLDLTPAEWRAIMRANTDLIGNVAYDPVTGKHPEFGFGRLNAGSLLNNLGKTEIAVLSPVADLNSGVDVIQFGSLLVGQTGSLTLRIRNQGSLPLDVTELSLSGDSFAIEDDVSPISLGLGEWTTVTIRAQSLSPGQFTGVLNIASNDNDESIFSIQLAVDVAHADVSGTVFEDRDGDGMRQAGEPGIPGQLIYLDLNNNDTIDYVNEEFTESDPVQILDNTRVTSTQLISGINGPVTDINILINISHSYVSDLDIALISPNGTRVLLASDVGGNGNNFVDTLFDDEATNSIVGGSAPFTGSFRPATPLDAFDGADANGVWTLEVIDFFNGDEGQIVNWTLQVESTEPAVVSDAQGGFYFRTLENGTYSVRSEVPSGWTGTQPASREYEVTLTGPSDFYADRNFGSARNQRAYLTVFHDINGNGTQDSGELGLQSRELMIDFDGDAAIDSESHTAANTSDFPINDFQTVLSPIAVTGLAGVVQDVDVRINVNHTYNSDLQVYLIGPQGTRVELFTGVGGNSDNFIDTVLDDDASSSITSGAAPFTGSYRPVGSLAALNGSNPNGTWRLEIFDRFSGDVGTLNEWELILNYGDYIYTSNAQGAFDIDLPLGSATARLMELPEWDFTVPSDGTRLLSISNAPLYEQLFGSVEEPTNNPPTDVTVSNDLVLENSPTTTAFVVGNFSTTDPDSGDTHTYLLAAGMGADDNALFEISGDTLLVKAGVILDYELRDSFAIRVRSTDAGGAFIEKEFIVSVGNLPEVAQIVVGDGGNQRSVVRQVVVQFDDVVTIESGAFEVNKRGAGGGPVAVAFSTSQIAGKTHATLTFSGTHVTSGSLNDGNYDLRIIGSKITNGSDVQLDGDRNGTAGGDRLFGTAAVDKFFRLYGDETGDRAVTLAEFNRFRSTFGLSSGHANYLGAFDFNNDAVISLTDFNAFRARFGTTLPLP